MAESRQSDSIDLPALLSSSLNLSQTLSSIMVESEQNNDINPTTPLSFLPDTPHSPTSSMGESPQSDDTNPTTALSSSIDIYISPSSTMLDSEQNNVINPATLHSPSCIEMSKLFLSVIPFCITLNITILGCIHMLRKGLSSKPFESCDEMERFRWMWSMICCFAMLGILRHTWYSQRSSAEGTALLFRRT